jgi:hypothetical protein
VVIDEEPWGRDRILAQMRVSFPDCWERLKDVGRGEMTMGWLQKNRQEVLTGWHAIGDVASVRMITTRDDTGIDYDVYVELRSRQEHVREEMDAFAPVWSERVCFGSTDATCAGGSAFVHAAREQQRAADEVWQFVHAPLTQEMREAT